LSRLPATAEPFRFIDPAASLFDRVEVCQQERVVSVIVPSIAPKSLSAGPMTALRLADALGQRLRLGVRIVTSLRWGESSPDAEEALRERLHSPISFAHVGAGAVTTASTTDIWLATYWNTALALDVAVRSDIVRPEQVVYLIQDYEPAFAPWSTRWAVTQSTYHAGFKHVVNSTPLAEYLRVHEGLDTPAEYILAPDLNLARLGQVAAHRGDDGQDVFFYARPSIARNLYELGLAALARAAMRTERPWRLYLAGEDIPLPPLSGVDMVNMGRTDLEGYFDLMTKTPIALSLMLSPHPSHPPLDWATSGGWAVTNRFENFRDGLHPRVLTAPADPDALGALLARTIDTVSTGAFLVPEPLGRPMGEVVESLARVIDAG
jgi:hypothetical protein